MRSSRVRAAVCHGFGRPMPVEELHLRPAGVGEVTLAVSACGVCHSDVTYWSGAWGGELPAVFGHEVAGVVEEFGEGVVGVAPGDSAVVTLVRYCGHCRSCARGLPALCEKMGQLWTSAHPPLSTFSGGPVTQGLRTAGFAEKVTVHASQVVVVPSGVRLDTACLIGCGVVTGVGAVFNTAHVEPGTTVVVVGAGGVGLNVIQGATIAGAARIIAVDLVGHKLEAAKSFGAGEVLDASSDEPVGAVAELTGGRRADYVFVAAGSARAVEQAMGMVARGGTVVVLGMPAGALASIDPEALADNGIRVLGSKVGSTRPQLDIPFITGLYLDGRLKLDELVSHRFSLHEINDAFALSASGESLRSVVVF